MSVAPDVTVSHLGQTRASIPLLMSLADAANKSKEILTTIYDTNIQ
jgi:hypothetical protein